LGGRSLVSQFITSSNPHLDSVMSTLESEGLIKEWKGNFGLLGARGGFVSSKTVTLAMDGKTMGDENSDVTNTPTTDTGDFCGFLRNCHSHKLYKTDATICDRICHLGGIETRLSTAVKTPKFLDSKWIISTNEDVEVVEIDDGSKKGDKVEKEKEKVKVDSSTSTSEAFDAIVIATHNPAYAANILDSLGDESVSKLSNALSSLREDNKRPVCTLRVHYPAGTLSNVPFDAATVPADSTVQFLSVTDAHVVTAVSTSSFAELHLERGGGKQTQMALLNATNRLLEQFIGERPEIIDSSIKIWRAAFTNASLGDEEECVSIEPYKMAIAGDFICGAKGTPGEAGAVSGLMAGEMLATWFGGQGK